MSSSESESTREAWVRFFESAMGFIRADEGVLEVRGRVERGEDLEEALFLDPREMEMGLLAGACFGGGIVACAERKKRNVVMPMEFRDVDMEISKVVLYSWHWWRRNGSDRAEPRDLQIVFYIFTSITSFFSTRVSLCIQYSKKVSGIGQVVRVGKLVSN